MGRPTKWSLELEEKALLYIQDYVDHGDMIPSVVGLCVHLDITRTSVYLWAKQDDKSFSYILSAINQKQEQVLINKGLSGDFNSNITKLVLGKHGYHDKVDSQLTGEGGGPIQTQAIEFIPVSNDD